MATMLFAIGSKKVGLSKVEDMLKNPEKGNWPPGIGLADPNGLHLIDVEYDESVFDGATDRYELLPVLPHPDPIENKHSDIVYNENVYNLLRFLIRSPRVKTMPYFTSGGCESKSE